MQEERAWGERRHLRILMDGGDSSGIADGREILRDPFPKSSTLRGSVNICTVAVTRARTRNKPKKRVSHRPISHFYNCNPNM